MTDTMRELDEAPLTRAELDDFVVLVLGTLRHAMSKLEQQLPSASDKEAVAMADWAVDTARLVSPILYPGAESRVAATAGLVGAYAEAVDTPPVHLRAYALLRARVPGIGRFKDFDLMPQPSGGP